ncbi:MAG: hypothetical protein H6Q83_353, partial [Deltaproteobacteria bacterium]|nr:hypothetical protein [Deltaproteobacteria bacterium]
YGIQTVPYPLAIPPVAGMVRGLGLKPGAVPYILYR